MRGFGEAEFAASLPEWVVAVAGVVTQFGDMWFVVVGVLLVYVVGQRTGRLSRSPQRDALYLLALVMGSYALTVLLKATFTLPRPPGAGTALVPAWLPGSLAVVYEGMVTGTGFGFPSGHALKTTVVYGGAALTLSVWERRDQVLAAGVVVVLVASSRVLLGVHYLSDVVGGVVFGALFLVAMERATRRDPRRALLVAAGVGLLAAAVAVSVKAGIAALACACGLLLWERHWKVAENESGSGLGVGSR